MLKTEITEKPSVTHKTYFMPGSPYFEPDDPDAERVVDDVAIKSALLYQKNMAMDIIISKTDVHVLVQGPLTFGPIGRLEIRKLAETLRDAICQALPDAEPDDQEYLEALLPGLDDYASRYA